MRYLYVIYVFRLSTLIHGVDGTDLSVLCIAYPPILVYEDFTFEARVIDYVLGSVEMRSLLLKDILYDVLSVSIFCLLCIVK